MSKPDRESAPHRNFAPDDAVWGADCVSLLDAHTDEMLGRCIMRPSWTDDSGVWIAAFCCFDFNTREARAAIRCGMTKITLQESAATHIRQMLKKAIKEHEIALNGDGCFDPVSFLDWLDWISRDDMQFNTVKVRTAIANQRCTQSGVVQLTQSDAKAAARKPCGRPRGSANWDRIITELQDSMNGTMDNKALARAVKFNKPRAVREAIRRMNLSETHAGLVETRNGKATLTKAGKAWPQKK